MTPRRDRPRRCADTLSKPNPGRAAHAARQRTLVRMLNEPFTQAQTHALSKPKPGRGTRPVTHRRKAKGWSSEYCNRKVWSA
eukprot:2978328-Prymnesium_polylepis.2